MKWHRGTTPVLGREVYNMWISHEENNELFSA
jgi:hypothetical protein